MCVCNVRKHIANNSFDSKSAKTHSGRLIRKHCLHHNNCDCFGIPSEISTSLAMHASHIAAELNRIDFPHKQHKIVFAVCCGNADIVYI